MLISLLGFFFFLSILVIVVVHMLQNFPWLITLGQQEACDWTGKKEAASEELQRQGASQRRKEEGQDGGGHEPAWLQPATGSYGIIRLE